MLILFYFHSNFIFAENFFTGRELLEHCENCVNSVNVSSVNACAYCVSNMSMMHDAFVGWDLMSPKWCLSKEISNKELTKTIMMYVRENPDSLRQYSTKIVANSLILNYPCSQ